MYVRQNVKIQHKLYKYSVLRYRYVNKTTLIKTKNKSVKTNLDGLSVI